jgi:exopolysaccharide biosynthesis predicted pyruvyltransferase EpsI
MARVSPRPAADPNLGGRLVDAQARLAVARGIGIIGPAELVVTDRLHAALLARALGRSVVAVDSATGKVHDVLRTWLPDDEQIRLVTSWPEAEALLATRGAAQTG